jgi:hypothetical protein
MVGSGVRLQSDEEVGPMRQYLVVANQTLDSERLAQKLSTCLAAGAVPVAHLVAPAPALRHAG